VGWDALKPAEQWDVALKIASFVLTLVTAILGLMRCPFARTSRCESWPAVTVHS